MMPLTRIRRFSVRLRLVRMGNESRAKPAATIGKRICVYGIGGKTSLSRALGTAKGLPVIEMDAFHWLPDWVERDRGEMVELLQERIAECSDGWVLDGNYSNIAPLFLPLADTAIWLNMPIRVSAPKLLIRSLSNYVRRKRICGENYERLRSMFQPVWWRIRHGSAQQRRVAERLREVDHSATVIEVRSYRELNRLYADLGLDPKRYRT